MPYRYPPQFKIATRQNHAAPAMIASLRCGLGRHSWPIDPASENPAVGIAGHHVGRHEALVRGHAKEERFGRAGAGTCTSRGFPASSATRSPQVGVANVTVSASRRCGRAA